MTVLQVLVLVSIAGLAGLVRGFSGFGSAMIFTSTLVLVLEEPTQALPVVLLLEAVLSVRMFPGACRGADWRGIGWFVGFAAVGSVPAFVLLRHIDPSWVALGTPLVVLALGVCLAAGARTSGRLGAGTLLAGSAAGFSGVCAGVCGPPAVLYYVASPLPGAKVRDTLIALFFLLDVGILGAHLALGGLTAGTAVVAAVAAPAMLVGAAVGVRWFGGGGQGRYRGVALGLVMATALVSLGLQLAGIGG